MRLHPRPTVLFILALGGCSAKPSDIAWDSPPGPIVSADPVPLRGRVVDSDGEPVGGASVHYALSPREIADITPDGVLVCGKAGKVSVTMTAGELIRTVDLLCALVARIDAPQELRLVVGESARPLAAKALDAAGQTIDGVPVEVTSADPTVVAAGPEGLSGQAMGVTRLTLKAGAVQMELPVEVVEIGSIELPDAVFLQVGEAPEALTANVRTIDGRLIRDFALQGEVEDPSIAELIDGKLVPRQYGLTSVRLAAGRATRSVQVAVTEEMPPVAVSISDGSTQSIAFTPGVYAIRGEIEATDGSGYGVIAQWQGAACGGSSETQRLVLVCKTDVQATLILSNPTTFGMGPAARGTLSVLRSPIPFPIRD